jgi:hypothetical protein
MLYLLKSVFAVITYSVGLKENLLVVPGRSNFMVVLKLPLNGSGFKSSNFL